MTAMGLIHHCLHILNEFTGAILLLIAVYIRSGASMLRLLKLEVECLHEDYDAMTNTHEHHAQQREALADERVAQAVRIKKLN